MRFWILSSDRYVGPLVATSLSIRIILLDLIAESPDALGIFAVVSI
jgi:hypothetical protein